MKPISTYIANNTICEDSLDDFDIDGKIARKRASVSEKRKREIHRKISQNVNDLIPIITEFFEERHLNIKQSKYTRSDGWNIRHETGFGFTYDNDDSVYFNITVGEYGDIDGVGRDERKCKEFLKEMFEYIKQKSDKNFGTHISIHKTSLNSFDSAAYRLTFLLLVKNL